MLTPIYEEVHEVLLGSIPKTRMFHDALHTLAYGTDASFYRLIPKLVINAKDSKEVSLILKEAQKRNLPVTFRAAGTSLSGQAISDSILVIAGEHWKQYKVLDEGTKIRLQPGIIGARANTYLKKYAKKIGPDPASINAAMIGGIAANNASGMCCGTAENSYKTVESMKVIFHDGTLLDTGDEESKKSFRQTHSFLLKEIENLAKSIQNNEKLAERIRNKFAMKNTTGYSLNAFVDYSEAFDIINHIMIGSEGTLGFIAEITYKTVEDLPHKASALMIFPDIEKACNAVSTLKTEPVAAVELIDRAGLRSVEDNEGMPSYLKNLSDGASAILVEVRAKTASEMQAKIATVLQAIKHIPSEIPIEFTAIPEEYAVYWKIRKGLFPSVGAIRKTGTTVIIEDVAFPVSHLAEATLDLQKLFSKYNYTEAVIFGHALEGNLHFVFTQDFGSQEQIDRYEEFIAELAKLVVDKYDGALKAEHGTGRNMAPFVEKEWGEEAYEIMVKIKEIFDPNYLLNPGVILNNNPKAHIENLKPLPKANEVVDKCIECGFCEPSCVSHELTLSPRQRIVAYRHIAELKRSNESHIELSSILSAYKYAGIETCAVDGLCATACPVKINTGMLVKELRFDRHTKIQNHLAWWLANHTAIVTSLARNGLKTVSFFQNILGDSLMNRIATNVRKLSGNAIPQWNRHLPTGANSIKQQVVKTSNPKKVVYFPSCINRSMGVSKENKGKKQLAEVMQNVIEKAGYEVIYPEKLNEMCCGMPYFSKGFREQGKSKSDELRAALWKASEKGQYPICCDMSPCLYTMKEHMEGLKLYEPTEFILTFLKSELNFTQKVSKPISVFPVCSMKKMGRDTHLLELANLCAENVTMIDANCCGFAGDRGFSHPELNAHGLRNLKQQQTKARTKRGYSTSRTCEIGLSNNGEITYESIVYLVDEVTIKK